MKKIRWSTLSDTDMEASGNRITLKGDFSDKQLEVNIIDKDKKDDEVTKTKRFMDVKMDKHKLLITLNFQWKMKNYQETSSSNIEYVIKRDDDCWKVDEKEGKLVVKPGKKTEFKRAKKEMHKKLLQENFKENLDPKHDKEEIKEADMKYSILPDGRGDYKVRIYHNDSSDDREFLWEEIEIEPNYWQNKVVDSDNAFNVVYQEETKEPQRWSTGRIIFFVTLSIGVLLVIIFWKKIWKWVKGEREQEKKVREQLDIF